MKLEVILEQLKEKLLESVSSVLPIFAVVLVLSVTIAPFNAGVLVLFLFGAVFLSTTLGKHLYLSALTLDRKPLKQSN